MYLPSCRETAPQPKTGIIIHAHPGAGRAAGCGAQGGRRISSSQDDEPTSKSPTMAARRPHTFCGPMPRRSHAAAWSQVGSELPERSGPILITCPPTCKGTNNIHHGPIIQPLSGKVPAKKSKARRGRCDLHLAAGSAFYPSALYFVGTLSG